MVALVVSDDSLTIRLSAGEKIMALHGDVTVPRSAVTSLRAVADPWNELRGIRFGTGVPGSIALGTWRGSGFADFVALRGSGSGVVVTLTGQRFDRLLVTGPLPSDAAGFTVERAEAVAARSERAASWSRSALLLTLTVLLIAAGVVSLVVGWGHLPSPLAVHWGLSGAPNGSGSKAVLVGIFAGLVVLPSLIAALVIVTGGPRTLRGFPAVVCLPVAAVGSIACVATVWANYDASDWTAARHLPAWMTALFILLPIGLLTLSVLVMRPGRRATPAR